MNIFIFIRSVLIVTCIFLIHTDFDDMSCEMIFGEEPPESTNDPALKQPCYKLCNISIYNESS